MMRITISLPEKLYQWIRKEAFRLNISIAHFIRNLIEEKKNV